MQFMLHAIVPNSYFYLVQEILNWKIDGKERNKKFIIMPSHNSFKLLKIPFHANSNLT